MFGCIVSGVIDFELVMVDGDVLCVGDWVDFLVGGMVFFGVFGVFLKIEVQVVLCYNLCECVWVELFDDLFDCWEVLVVSY